MYFNRHSQITYKLNPPTPAYQLITMTFLKVTQIAKQEQQQWILKDIEFTQKRLQKIAITGETGSGKSTLLKIIAGLIQPDEGEIWLNENLVEGPDHKLVPGHSEIAYLSQHFELPKFLRVEQVLSYANILSTEEATTLYTVCQINHLLQRKTDALSGGERQRIALTLLLVTSPTLLLLDEPFSNLDPPHKQTLKEVIEAIGNQLKITCILVSHDPTDTLPWADRIIVLRDGNMLQQGSPQKIYNQPIDAYTAGMFGSFNTIRPNSSTHSAFFENRSNRKTLFLRPEHLRIASTKKQAIKGVVSAIRYLGSFSEVEVLTEDDSLVVQTTEVQSLGAVVYVSLSPDYIASLNK